MRKVLLAAVTVGASLVLGLVLVEAGLRVADWSRPPFYLYDIDTGTSHRPRAEGWYVEENAVRVSINRDGLRGPEIAREKPAATYRIAVLGDSFAEGFQVTFEERFSHVAEVALAGCAAAPGRVEIINFGVSGYGQARELLMLRHKAAAYAPDLVLVLFHGGNDFGNNMKAWEQNPFNPYYVWEGDRLVLDDSFRRNADFQRKLRWSNLRNDVVAHSRLLQVLQTVYENEILVPALAEDAATRRETVPEHSPMSLAPPADDGAREAWRTTEALLLLMRDEAGGLGAALWLANVPPAAAVTPDAEARRRELALYGLAHPDYVETRLRTFTAASGIGMVPLTEPLRAAARAAGVDPHYHAWRGSLGGHWNAMAHRVAGEAIARDICAAFGDGRLGRSRS
ncbi:MAG: SGNH/GDSL hydrolase family protein [Alphaproteobacteria bacterium]